MRSLPVLLRLPLFEKLNVMSLLYARIKTRLYYKFAFGAMGRNCVILSPLLLSNTKHVSIGDRVFIRNGARFDIVIHRYGVDYRPRVVIEDGVSCEQNLHIACAEEIIIEKDVAITENVGIFDILHPFENVGLPIVKQPLRTLPVRIGTGSLIGMNAVIMPGVTIGEHCIIGANSVVTKSISAYSVAVGAPARVIKRFDSQKEQWVRFD